MVLRGPVRQHPHGPDCQAEAGPAHRASALYGYRKDPDRKGGLLPDPEAAEIVREIFRRYADGWGKTAIVRDLNRRAVPCPSAYKRLHGLPCGGKTGEIWREATVSGILRNEMSVSYTHLTLPTSNHV